MSTQGTVADADGDIAALVYASGDRPDLILRDFAKRLADAGHRVCGLIQLRDRSIGVTHGRVMVLDGREVQVVEVARKDDAVGGSGCRLAGDWLDRMGRQMKASIRRGVDAVIVNRFGALEVQGAAFVMRSWPLPRTENAAHHRGSGIRVRALDAVLQRCARRVRALPTSAENSMMCVALHYEVNASGPVAI